MIHQGLIGIVSAIALASPPAANEEVSSSLLAGTIAQAPMAAMEGGVVEPATLSLFAVEAPEARLFAIHDLVQIIVRETSRARRSQDLETQKDWELDGRIAAWPDFDLVDLLQLQLRASDTSDLPRLRMNFGKDFTGEGEYERRDDMTDRLTAEVIEILPNGNLILEARTSIMTDKETSVMKVTGICRPDDVTPANTVLSNQIHDLVIERMHDGELKQAAEKGIIAKVLETVFAF